MQTFVLQPGSLQEKPKRLRLLVDVSGSMYRFNGLDGRLERSMEVALMVMEAFEQYEHKFKVPCITHNFIWFLKLRLRAVDIF